MIIWKRVSNAILNLEKFVKANPQNPHTRELLSSIATHQWQVTREIFHRRNSSRLETEWFELEGAVLAPLRRSHDNEAEFGVLL